MMNIDEILEYLPHRYPFLLVDRVTEVEKGKSIKGYKNISFNESFFQGHFPGQPVFPGVLMIEGLAQAGGLLLMDVVDNPEDKVVYFMTMDKVKFRKPVQPGDVLEYRMTKLNQRRAMWWYRGEAYVGDTLVAEAELSAKEPISFVQLSGVADDEISIEIDRDALRAYGLALTDVARIVGQNSLDLPGGDLTLEGEEVVLRVEGQNYQRSDYEQIVITATDGFDALAKIADTKPDIIFVDIMMPRLDGYQTCALIKNNSEFKETPVIMLSSKDGLFDKAKGRIVGSDQYLTKPFSKNELLGAIQAHVGEAHSA